ncbi:hypothetical protein C7441_11064 [Pseudaminobacter salicylatoxidans]|uniref:Uncharacterized protein n=1 Tax=Pseudaminobacter salicylatoxidans TaxID=93369 RepID=A0A316C0L0_PSESE|nr:hypothetical protein [Pseudaminobacter salicylatoxidans]PWJ81532.1 hypothetical protein C7441_11064 [Pseudaminobacter salicylatoxidans]
MTLDPKSLEAAWSLYHGSTLDKRAALDAAITAYLTHAARDGVVAGLVDRLRGIYRIPITDGLGAVGSGEEPDNPNEFVRRFETSPIQHEAATTLLALSARAEAAEERVKKLEAALANIAEGRPENPAGDPWSFYDDLVSVARSTLAKEGGDV